VAEGHCEVLVGACNLRPLFFILFYFLLFIFYSLDALPCPALPLPCPALPLPCPAPAPALPGTGGGSYIGNGQCFFFLLLPGTGGGSYPHGRMTVRADSRVTSILIPKTVQNGIKGCFISHPQKNSSKRNQGVASFLIPKSFHI
jgi:hypothetical protein